jgi:hypothetical protein
MWDTSRVLSAEFGLCLGARGEIWRLGGWYGWYRPHFQCFDGDMLLRGKDVDLGVEVLYIGCAVFLQRNNSLYT